MKKVIFLFFIIPSLLFSQEFENSKPLTTFANIEFKDGQISYVVNSNLVLLYPDLLPDIYDKNVLRLSYNNEHNSIGSKYISESRKNISSFLDSGIIDSMSSNDQIDYLRLCALLAIWEGKLNKHAIIELEKLSNIGSNDIKIKAKLVQGLLY